MNILAIDPGQSGGLCFTDTALDYKHVMALPLDGQKLPDIFKIHNLIITKAVDVVILEEQLSLSGQRGQGGIMRAYGRLETAAMLANVCVYEVSAKQWQKILGLSGDKQSHCEYAIAAGFDIPYTSYKKNGEPMARAKLHDGIGDAACIAIAYAGDAASDDERGRRNGRFCVH